MAQGQLENGGFNNWTVNTHGDGFPTGWTTSFNEYGINYPGVSFLNNSNDASHLTSSIKLTTSVIDSDTSFAFTLLGSIGNGEPVGGVPFSTTVDSIVFDAKFDLLNDDTANVLVFFKLNGTPIDMNIFKLAGTQSNWTRYSFPVNSFNIPNDTLILGFTSGDIDNDMATEGSWLMVDNIRFKNGSTEITSIPNPSFEDWTDITSESPNDWFTYNEFTSPTGFATVVKTTNSNEGTFALELRPDTLHVNDNHYFIESVLIYGSQNFNTGQTTGKPFTASPTNLIGMYKWEPNGIDTARIDIVFTYLSSYVGFASLEIINGQSDFTALDIPLTLGDVPDSVLIIVNGGKAGSILTIDDLKFNGGNVGVNAIHLSEATSGVYPNPTSSDAFLKIGLVQSATVSYNVMNALGQTVSTQNMGYKKAGVYTIDLNSNDFKSGVYFVKVLIDNKETTHKLIVR